MKDKLRQEVRDYIRQQYHLNGGGMVCGNLNDLIFGFAEPKESRIEELEKENEELKKKLKEELKTIADKDLSFVARFDALEKENAELKEQLDAIDKAGEHVRQQITDAFRNKKPYWELEQENAKLKEENEKFDKQIDTMLEDCKRCTYRKTSEQLERAKRILKMKEWST